MNNVTSDLIETPEKSGHRCPVCRNINPLVLVDLDQGLVQPPDEGAQDRLHGDLGPVRVGEDDQDILGQAGAAHRVQVVGGELEEARGDLVHLDEAFLIKQLDCLLLSGFLQKLGFITRSSDC